MRPMYAGAAQGWPIEWLWRLAAVAAAVALSSPLVEEEPGVGPPAPRGRTAPSWRTAGAARLRAALAAVVSEAEPTARWAEGEAAVVTLSTMKAWAAGGAGGAEAASVVAAVVACPSRGEARAAGVVVPASDRQGLCSRAELEQATER